MNKSKEAVPHLCLEGNNLYTDILKNLVEIQLDRIHRDSLVFVEVGSFDGRHAIHWADDHPKSTVYAIEPCPSNYKVLARNVRNHKNIQPHRVAISDVNDRVKFFITRHPKYKDEGLTSQSNSLYRNFVCSKQDNLKDESVRVKTRTLDTFCSDENISRIDLLEINCEGGEYRMFPLSSVGFLAKTNVIDIVFHGKSPEFLHYKFVKKKLAINRMLVNNGFKIIYGQDLNELKKLPLRHIRQVWIRKRFI